MLHRRWKSGISRSHTCLPSCLLSLLTELLPSLPHLHPRAWGQNTLGNWVGGTTQSHCGLRTLEGPLRAGHRGLRVGSPPNHHLPVPSRDAASISFPLITRSSIPPGEGLRDKVTNSSGRPTKYAVPALPVSQVFSPHSLSPEPA